MLKFCDANTNPNDRDYGFYHNGTAWQASFFLPMQGNQFPESEAQWWVKRKGWGGYCGRGELAKLLFKILIYVL